jgi:hypothetical protein
VQEVTKKSGGKKGKAKGGKGKGSSSSAAEEPVKAKYKACRSFFQFFMQDPSSSSKQAVHPSMLPFTPDDEDDNEVSTSTEEQEEFSAATCRISRPCSAAVRRAMQQQCMCWHMWASFVPFSVQLCSELGSCLC